MSKFRIALTVILLCAVGSSTVESADAGKNQRLNIVWIIVDDMSPHFSAYGEKTIQTPHVDRLASQGTVFTHCFVTAPVCSPSRSALMTGMFQTSIGAHHHRSGRGVERIRLPAGVEPLPVLFQRAGYYTAIGGWPPRENEFGKTDYNFEWDRSMYHGVDWSGRAAGQPFFMQVQLHGGKHRHSSYWKEVVLRELGSLTQPGDVTLPPYYPRDPVLLDDWAQYLDACRYTDKQVGQIVDRLKREGLFENTVIFFMTDHGISHARGKQFLYDEGIHVPLVVSGPGVPQQRRTDLVQHIDLAATSLAVAGIPIPAQMQARDLAILNDGSPSKLKESGGHNAGTAIFSARDRCDETVDHLRCIRTPEFKYIRNFLPQRPLLQPNRYKDEKEIVLRLRRLHQQEQLNALQEQLLFSATRPAEELYDLGHDPYETQNLADDPRFSDTLQDLRERLNRWMEETNDLGREPEPERMYDSDMAVYLHEVGPRNAVARQTIERNIALMKQWARDGK